MNALQMVRLYGSSLVGRRVSTVREGEWPGGPATVTKLRPDPNAPMIVMQVRRPDGDEIGIFCDEAVELLHESEAEPCIACAGTGVNDDVWVRGREPAKGAPPGADLAVKHMAAMLEAHYDDPEHEVFAWIGATLGHGHRRGVSMRRCAQIAAGMAAAMQDETEPALIESAADAEMAEPRAPKAPAGVVPLDGLVVEVAGPCLNQHCPDNEYATVGLARILPDGTLDTGSLQARLCTTCFVAAQKQGLVVTHADSIGFPPPQRQCRECGCTDRDCRDCIERTGQPCSWVEEDLCSACFGAGDGS